MAQPISGSVGQRRAASRGIFFGREKSGVTASGGYVFVCNRRLEDRKHHRREYCRARSRRSGMYHWPVNRFAAWLRNQTVACCQRDRLLPTVMAPTSESGVEQRTE